MGRSRSTYNLPKKQDILSSHQEQSTLNVGIEVVHEEALNRILKHQVAYIPQSICNSIF